MDRGSEVAIKLLGIGSPSDHTFLQVVELFPSDQHSHPPGRRVWQSVTGLTCWFLCFAVCPLLRTLRHRAVWASESEKSVGEGSDWSLSAGGASYCPHYPPLTSEELAVLCHGQRKS